MVKNIIIACSFLVIGILVGSLIRIQKTENLALQMASHPSNYFQQKLNNRTVEHIGQAIEGFDASMYMHAFPGLHIEDFKNVPTVEGRYTGKLESNENGEIPEYVGKQMTSTSTTITNEGLEVLRINLSKRLGLDPNDPESVNEIFTFIDTSGEVIIQLLGYSGAFDMNLIPREVVEDSRCPTDVQCVQAGTVRVRTFIDDGSDPEHEEIFTLGTPIDFGTHVVTLKDVGPSKNSQFRLQPEHYNFYFKIEKK